MAFSVKAEGSIINLRHLGDSEGQLDVIASERG